MAFSSFCSTKIILLLFVMSAVPIAFIIAVERSTPSTHVYQIRSLGWVRECVKWDDLNRRFLASQMEGGAVGEIKVPDHYSSSSSGGVDILEEVTVVKYGGGMRNASLGMVVDEQRNRLLVAVADLLGNRHSWLAAYDLSSWNPLFLTQLGVPEDEKSLADDVAVDDEGNAYVTDAKASKIWKVSEDGKLLSVIRSPLFISKEWYKNLIALNGIVYHPDGFLLVVHTVTGNLYKVDVKTGEEVKMVKIVKGSLRFGDGMVLLSPNKLVVAGNSPTARLVESSDGWETAEVVGKFYGPIHRLATSATAKDGRVYISHLLGAPAGLGDPKKRHVLVEAVFS
ncbi:hypothetical protein Ancab_020346 [Ancistrocladus abbreviatus]